MLIVHASDTLYKKLINYILKTILRKTIFRDKEKILERDVFQQYCNKLLRVFYFFHAQIERHLTKSGREYHLLAIK